ncbi:MAG: M67 family metallopeptidase [Phycisphaerae bacterium]
MTKLIIPKEIFKQMLEQAAAEAPIEACGILAGKAGEIKKFYKMINADNSSEHFTMEPQEQFKVIKDIRLAGLEMLAIYHSHPNSPARPSEEDMRMALTPDVVYIILSIMSIEIPVIKGFRITDRNASDVAVEIV